MYRYNKIVWIDTGPTFRGMTQRDSWYGFVNNRYTAFVFSNFLQIKGLHKTLFLQEKLSVCYLSLCIVPWSMWWYVVAFFVLWWGYHRRDSRPCNHSYCHLLLVKARHSGQFFLGPFENHKWPGPRAVELVRLAPWRHFLIEWGCVAYSIRYNRSQLIMYTKLRRFACLSISYLAIEVCKLFLSTCDLAFWLFEWL